MRKINSQTGKFSVQENNAVESELNFWKGLNVAKLEESQVEEKKIRVFYTGNSRRTAQRRSLNQKLLRTAAEGTRSILDFRVGAL